MSFDNHANFALANVTVAPSPATSGVSLTVDNASLFPAPPFNAVCWPATVLPTAASAEILRITSTGSNTFTIARAQEGSTAQAIAAGYQIAASLTAKILTDIESAIGSGGQTLATQAYNIAVAGTNAANEADQWARDAFSIACTGTNAANAAYSLATGALNEAWTGTNIGNAALSATVALMIYSGTNSGGGGGGSDFIANMVFS